MMSVLIVFVYVSVFVFRRSSRRCACTLGPSIGNYSSGARRGLF